MSEKVLFVLTPNYRDEEFYIPYNMIKDTDYQIDVAGLEKDEISGTKEHKFTPNLLFDNLTNENFEEYEALVIPGGPGSTTYIWGNKKLQNAIRYFHDHGKIVAAICYGSIAPVEAGILEGKEGTVSPTDEAKKIFEECKVIFVDKGVVTLEEEKIITSQGPKFCKEFGQAIIDLLKK